MMFVAYLGELASLSLGHLGNFSLTMGNWCEDAAEEARFHSFMSPPTCWKARHIHLHERVGGASTLQTILEGMISQVFNKPHDHVGRGLLGSALSLATL